MPFVGYILQLFQIEPIFTSAETQAKKDQDDTSAVFDQLIHHIT